MGDGRSAGSSYKHGGGGGLTGRVCGTMCPAPRIVAKVIVEYCVTQPPIWLLGVFQAVHGLVTGRLSDSTQASLSKKGTHASASPL